MLSARICGICVIRVPLFSNNKEKSMPDFHGLSTAILENEHIRVEYLTTAGPRIVGLSYHGSPNLLADVYGMSSDTPHGKFHFLGGHRLWIAPEALDTTYYPDDSGLQVKAQTDSVELI